MNRDGKDNGGLCAHWGSGGRCRKTASVVYTLSACEELGLSGTAEVDRKAFGILCSISWQERTKSRRLGGDYTSFQSLLATAKMRKKEVGRFCFDHNDHQTTETIYFFYLNNIRRKRQQRHALDR